MLNQSYSQASSRGYTKARPEVAKANIAKMRKILGVAIDEPKSNSEKGRAIAQTFMNHSSRIIKQQ